ncbi:MAG: response regulator transcription factor [Patescibacteria group bacterium]|jgi:DNA-binding response OmpR family regulator
MKVLLIEDDQDITASLTSFFKENNIILDIANDGERGSWLSLINDYDLILSDYNLPKMNGKEIIDKMRNEGKSTPVIMLTVRTDLEDKIDILRIGADDYLTKPFSFCELLARMQAISRRPLKLNEKKMFIKDLELDTEKFSVKKGGRNINLRAKEFSLLEYLMRRKGCFLSRQEIMEHVWDENADPFSNTIEVHIMNLRRKIETKKERFIFTVSNRGYKIDEKR